MIDRDLEEANWREIRRLNQRGGRSLSIVDLIRAGTLNTDMAAYMFRRLTEGCSFLTAAVPGNAGKTTLMAALLGLIKPGCVIRTVGRGAGSPGRVRVDPSTYLLAHEIGSGPYLGYLWGREIRVLFDRINGGGFFVSCIHADTPAQIEEQLRSDAVGLRPQDLRRIDLVLFIHMDGRLGNYQRRVAGIYDFSVPDTDLLFTWDLSQDRFECQSDEVRSINLRESVEYSFLADLVSEGINDFVEVRKHVLDFYRKR